jgi:hypothetical protein
MSSHNVFCSKSTVTEICVNSFNRFREEYKDRLGLYKSSGVSWQRAEKANEHTAVNFEAMVNSVLKEKHEEFPETDPRFFPWPSLSDVPKENLYGMDEVGFNGEGNKKRSLFGTAPEVSSTTHCSRAF